MDNAIIGNGVIRQGKNHFFSTRVYAIPVYHITIVKLQISSIWWSSIMIPSLNDGNELFDT